MDPSYTNPLGGQYQPTDYPPQGDIILTPDRPRVRLDKKRILILAGVGFVVLMLFVLVIMNIVKGGSSVPSAEISSFFENNYRCISMLEEDDVWAANNSFKTGFYLNDSRLSETKLCVKLLAAAKDELHTLGSWHNDKISASGFETLKQDLLSFILMEEKKVVVYENFYNAFVENSMNPVREYLYPETVSKTNEDGENVAVIPDDALNLKIAAERLQAYFDTKEATIANAQENYCDVDIEYSSDDVCSYFTDYYKKNESGIINNTTIARLIVLSFNSDYDIENAQGITQRINLILGTDENE